MYADVIVPLPLSGLYTYAVPMEMQPGITRGSRVVVPFGSRKYYTAIVAKVHRQPPGNYTIKEIHSLIDSTPVVTEHQLDLWEWVSFYYLSSPGDVLRAAFPTPMIPADLQSGFIPKNEIHLRVNPAIDAAAIPIAIGRAKKQQLLMEEIRNLLAETGRDHLAREEAKELAGYSPAVLNGLLGKNLLLSFAVETGRLHPKNAPTRDPYILSGAQQKTLDAVQTFFSEKQTVLLHGVASSGKTEIYIHLIKQYLAEGKQVLYLLPEIAPTTRLSQPLRSVFGDKIGIYHSGINEQERTEIWQKMLSDNPYEIILGVRSSLFLPFRRLGLVIVDDEHDASYKQQDPAPRYHVRDTAVMLAHLSGAKTVLGSSTPSIESHFNAQTGKYGLVALKERFNKGVSPLIRIENTKELRRRKQMKTILAPALMEEINGALERNEQVILFRNRRGFAPVQECTACAWTPKCRRCDVVLSYHKKEHRLVCHYCNASYPVPDECPSCHDGELKFLGAGTERLEEEISQLFPGAVVARMDADSTRGKNSFERIVCDFQMNRIQILVGTQMITKWIDFNNVGVVGIIAADTMLNYPDFRSHERGFRLIAQAAGLAGCKGEQGKVFIQTADPEQPVYRFITGNDYEGFYHSQITERKLFKYPPFTRLITIVLKHKEERKAEAGADFFSHLLKQSLGDRVQGPNKPVISRIQQYSIREILLKAENTLSPVQVREWIKSAESRFRKDVNFRQIIVYYHVD